MSVGRGVIERAIVEVRDLLLSLHSHSHTKRDYSLQCDVSREEKERAEEEKRKEAAIAQKVSHAMAEGRHESHLNEVAGKQ